MQYSLPLFKIVFFYQIIALMKIRKNRFKSKSVTNGNARVYAR